MAIVAFADADACIKVDPSNVKAYYRRGLAGKEQSLDKKCLEAAKLDFEKVVAMEPDNTVALKELKAVESKLELLSVVEDDSEPPLLVDPNASSSSSTTSSKDNSPMGFTKLSLEEVEEAKANSPSVVGGGGKTRIQIEEDSDEEDEEEEEKKALPTSRKIVIEDEDSDEDDDEDAANKEASDKLKNEGNKLLTSGKHSEAIAKYEAAISLDSTNVAAVNNKCLALLKLSKFVDAVQAADQVLALEPENVKGIFRKACAISGRGENAGAEALKEAMSLFEKSSKMGGGENAFRRGRTLPIPLCVGTSNRSIDPGGGKNCKEKDLCAAALKRLQAKEKQAASAPAPAVANPASPKEPSKSEIQKRVDDAMKKLNSGEKKPLVRPASFAVPKSTSEMETAIRSLRTDESGESVVQYLATFKAATFKKCFTLSMDPELLSQVFQSLSTSWSDGTSERNTKAVNQLAKVTKSLDIVFMVLDDNAKTAVADILGKAADQVTAAFWKKSFKKAL